MSNKFILLIGVVVALFFVACSRTNIKTNEKKDITLLGTYWKVLTLYEKKVDNYNKEAYIKINGDKTINGSLSCNNFFGTVKIEKDNISFEKMGSTRMLCENMQIEDNFQKVLNSTKTYKIEKNILSFYDQNGNKISTFIGVKNK